MRLFHNASRFAGATSLALLSACGSAGTEPDPAGQRPVLAATVDGDVITTTTASAVLTGAGNFIIAAAPVGSGAGLTLRLFSVGAPGTYPLGVTPALVGGSADFTRNFTTFTTPTTATAGTVTISSISTTRIAGTFAFTATRTFNFFETESRVVSDGRFDVPVSGSGTLEIPANIGSTITGSISAEPFVATGVTVVQNPGSGILQFQMRQGSRLVVVQVPDFTGVGAYALGTGTSRLMRLEGFVGTFPSTWGGSVASSSGNVVVTSLSATRVRGTINATLTPTFAPLGTAPGVIALNFDIGLP